MSDPDFQKVALTKKELLSEIDLTMRNCQEDYNRLLAIKGRSDIQEWMLAYDSASVAILGRLRGRIEKLQL